MRTKETGKIMKKIIIWIFWIIVWWLLSQAVDNEILLAGPLETGVVLWDMLGKGSFYLTVAGSLLRIGLGFVLGFLAAVLLAMASKRFGWLEDLLAPFMNLVKTIPVASFVVLLLIWWGSSFLAVAVSFLVVLPQIYISMLEGLKNADGQLLEMARVFRMSLWNRLFYIYRPALRPFLLSGLKISLGMCWKSGVAAEVIGTPDYSIGERLYLSKVYLDTAELFAWTAVIVVFCVFFEKLVLWLSERFFAWDAVCKPGCNRQCGRDAESLANSGKSAGQDDASDGIRLNGVSKSYAGQVVLNDISETYLPGETYYLTSPSGSGKTTLLRVLAGLTEADSGSIHGLGRCSMVFQEDRLCGDYSAVKNVEMVLGGGCNDQTGLPAQKVGIPNAYAQKDVAGNALRKLLPEDSRLYNDFQLPYEIPEFSNVLLKEQLNKNLYLLTR